LILTFFIIRILLENFLNLLYNKIELLREENEVGFINIYLENKNNNKDENNSAIRHFQDSKIQTQIIIQTS